MIEELVVAAAGLSGAVPAAVVDARHRRLPTPLLRASAVAVTATIAAFTLTGQPAQRATIAAIITIAVAGPAAALWWWKPHHIGFGDVRLLAVLAATLAWIEPLAIYPWLVASLMVAGLIAATTRARTIAFGPPLTATALVAAALAITTPATTVYGLDRTASPNRGLGAVTGVVVRHVGPSARGQPGRAHAIPMASPRRPNSKDVGPRTSRRGLHLRFDARLFDELTTVAHEAHMSRTYLMELIVGHVLAEPDVLDEIISSRPGTSVKDIDPRTTRRGMYMKFDARLFDKLTTVAHEAPISRAYLMKLIVGHVLAEPKVLAEIISSRPNASAREAAA